MQLARLCFNINGVDRFITCDPESDTLAEVLRRMGLTGVKVGCGTGVCGACSVILDGEVVRSCTKKMKRVPEFSQITTIEGIGTPQHLHPLQQAWITYGGAQCGFCSPGFIVSAYGLLQKNPSPTRQDVRTWFKDHHNICRCTGYKPLVDAVMAAAEVMRGDKTMADITYDFAGETEIYGSRHPRPTALAKVTGLADYGNDVEQQMPDGIAHLAVVLAEAHHANIISIDTSEAEEMPGVIRVMTADDVKGSNNMPVQGHVPRTKGTGVRQFPVIADKKILRRGDVVALVAADTREHAREAAKKVKQNLEVLPAYMTFPEAVMPNALQLHETLPNFHMEQPLFKGEDTAALFETAPVVVEGSFHSQHEPHLPIEPDVCQAYWGTDGMMTIQCKCQNLSENSEGIAMACGLPVENIRMQLNTVGGSFGYTIASSTFALAVTAVQNLDMPVSLILSYDEFNHTTGKRSATFTNGRLACDEGRQDRRRRVRRGPRPRRLPSGPDLQQPGVGRIPWLQHPEHQGAGARRLHEPCVQHRLPRIRRPADLHRHRGAHRHVRREGRHRPVGVPLQERRSAGRHHHQQPSVPGLRLSQAAGDGQAHLRQVQG